MTGAHITLFFSTDAMKGLSYFHVAANWGIYCVNHNNWLPLPSLWGEVLHADSNSSAWQIGSAHWFVNLQICECNQLGLSVGWGSLFFFSCRH